MFYKYGALRQNRISSERQRWMYGATRCIESYTVDGDSKCRAASLTRDTSSTSSVQVLARYRSWLHIHRRRSSAMRCHSTGRSGRDCASICKRATGQAEAGGHPRSRGQICGPTAHRGAGLWGNRKGELVCLTAQLASVIGPHSPSVDT